MKRIAIIMCVLLLGGGVARAQFSDLQTIEIGTLSTTHVVFTSDLSYVDISRQEVIAAKVVDASKNMLAIKAREPFDYVTTISALEANGTMHTFKVKYNPYPSQLIVDIRAGAQSSQQGLPVNTQIRPGSAATGGETPAQTAQGTSPVITVPQTGETASLNVTTAETSNFGRMDAPTLDEIMKYPQGIYHIGDRNFNIEGYVTNLFVYSDLIYVVLTLYNKSDIGFEAGDAQFTIETMERNRKSLATDKSVWAKSSYGSLSCPPRGTITAGYTIPKFTLLKNECLRIYIYEKQGTRNLILTLSDKDINYAVSPKRD